MCMVDAGNTYLEVAVATHGKLEQVTTHHLREETPLQCASGSRKPWAAGRSEPSCDRFLQTWEMLRCTLRLRGQLLACGGRAQSRRLFSCVQPLAGVANRRPLQAQRRKLMPSPPWTGWDCHSGSDFLLCFSQSTLSDCRESGQLLESFASSDWREH